MNRNSLWFVMGAVGACGTPQSSFDFTLGTFPRADDPTATGVVDNSGFVVIEDEAWSLGIDLGGLAVGSHDGSLVSILDKTHNTLFSGPCATVTVYPHDSTNGSAVSGLFTCTGLESTGAPADATGRFLTYINDGANNPNAPTRPGP